MEKSSIKITEDVFGEAINPLTKKAELIKRYTISNSNGVSVQIINLGATITSLKYPDEYGKVDDVVLGFDDVAGYQSSVNPYFGATIGRVCNRIANGKFHLNGRDVNISRNFNDKHTLHGGFIGFDKVHWHSNIAGGNKIEMSHTSEDGHEGFPGVVSTTVTFTLTDDNEFKMEFRATSTEPTPVNLTNHSYFNLAGHAAGKEEIYNHDMKINANEITVTDEDSIPTGDFKPVQVTPYDLRKMCRLGDKFQKLEEKHIIGFDDNYCVNMETLGSLVLVAKVYHSKSGRWMEVYSNQPGVQFYTSNYLPDPSNPNAKEVIGKDGMKYFKHGAFCLETQLYPDAVNHPNFPSTIISPGEMYRHDLILKVGGGKM